MKTFSISLTCASLIVLAGCENEAPYGTTQTGAYSGEVISSPAQYSSITPATHGDSATDSTLASQIRQALDTSSVAGDSRSINVSVQNGDVTLTGTIPSDSERHQVDDLVRNTSGVSAVYDQMQTAPVAGITQTYSPAYSSSVQPVAPTGRPEASGYANTMVTGDIFNLHVQGLNETDRTMAERILHGLRTDTTLNSLLPVVNITVMNGRIVLQGAVQNEQQRRTIASVIERAAGAANVENDLQVVGP